MCVYIYIAQLYKLEITDAYFHCKKLKSKISNLSKQIMDNVPKVIYKKFFYTQNIALNRRYKIQHNRLNRKFDWLVRRHTMDNIKEINNINYFWQHNEQTVHITDNQNLQVNGVSTKQIYIPKTTKQYTRGNY